MGDFYAKAQRLLSEGCRHGIVGPCTRCQEERRTAVVLKLRSEVAALTAERDAAVAERDALKQENERLVDAAANPLLGGLSSDQLCAAWDRELRGVTPTERDLAAFVVGMDAGSRHARSALAAERQQWLDIKAMSERLDQMALNLADENENLTAERDAAIARAEAAEADARRYRWLRDTGDATWAPMAARPGISGAHEIDAAIDAQEQGR